MLSIKRVQFACVVIISTLSFTAHAQFSVEGFLVSPRLSFADYSNQGNWDNYSVSKTPPLALQIEKYYNTYLSFGSYFGFKGESYKNDTTNNSYYKERTFSLATLGTFHYSDWLQRVFRDRIRFEDLDLYVSLSMRLDLEWTKANNLIKEEEVPRNSTNTELLFRVGPVAGIRYYISENFAMVGEVGTGNLGIVTMGVSWRL